MDKSRLKEIITSFHERALAEVIPRHLEVPLDTSKVVTLTGARRSGKTFLLYEVIGKLVSAGTPKEKVLYLNFEDERLKKEFELDEILQAYQELFPDFDLFECYFFFDEIQNITGWEKFIRRIHDSVCKNIFITGSNSSLLSKDIATALRGRTLTYEVYPLSFEEFLTFNKIVPNLHSSKSKAKLTNTFTTFLSQGGFPELVFLDADIHQRVLQEYFNTMLFRDLIERYDISQTTILKYFCKRLIANSGTEFSVHKVFNELKSQGYKISKNSLYDFQDYAESIYMSQFLMKYDESVVKRELAQKKAYAIDTGIANAIDFKFSKDLGRKLENFVYLELKKHEQEIVYLKNGFECDFLIMDRGHITTAIQVTYDMADEGTKQREVNGVVQACQKFGLTKGFILTNNQQAEMQQDNITIAILPAWRYFLNS